MVVQTSDLASVYDVIFVVEDTANLGAYFKQLKNAYIQPALENFNGGPPEEVDYGCNHSCSLYGLVTYYGADCFPEPASKCFRPTTSIYQLLKQLTDLQYIGGGGDGSTFLSEGLATVLALFDDLNKLRESNITTKKHCILLCNSAPCALPSQESLHYSGHMSEDLVNKLQQRDVCFSVISPRKIPGLFSLFDKNLTDHQLKKNYAVDSRHLVLLRGVNLEERPTSPGSQRDEAIIETTKKSTTVPSLPPNQVAPNRATNNQYSGQPNTTGGVSGGSIPNNQTAGTFKVPAASAAASGTPGTLQGAKQAAQEILEQAILGPTSQSSGSAMNPSVMTGPSQPQNVQHPINSQVSHTPSGIGYNQPNHGGMVNMGPRSAIVGMPNNTQQSYVAQGPGMPLNPQQQQQQQHPPPNPMVVQPNISGATGGGMSGPVGGPPIGGPGGPMQPPGPGPGGPQPGTMEQEILGVNINNPAHHLSVAAQNQQKRIIWSGALEWQEKAKTQTAQGPVVTGNKVMRTLACNVSLGPNEININASNWPAKLTMQLIPQHLLQPLHGLFRNSRTVGFTFGNHDMDGLRSLYKVMATGFAGCIHIPSGAQSDVRVLMLLYSNRKKQFMGLVPNDQAQFINGIRAVITNQRQLQNKGMSGASGGPVPGQGAFPGPQGQSGAMNNPGQVLPGGMPISTMGGVVTGNQTMSQPGASGGNMPTMASSMSNTISATSMTGGTTPAGTTGIGAGSGSSSGLITGGGQMSSQQPHQQQTSASSGMTVVGQVSQEELDRRANLQKIEELKQDLDARRAKEMQFQQAGRQHIPGQQQQHIPAQHQQQMMVAPPQFSGGPRQQPTGAMTPQHMQRLQHMQQQQALQSSNPQLRHLLLSQQQQQLRQQQMMQQQGQQQRGMAPPPPQGMMANPQGMQMQQRPPNFGGTMNENENFF